MLLPFNHCSRSSLFPWCLFANLKLIKLNLIQYLWCLFANLKLIKLNLIQTIFLPLFYWIENHTIMAFFSNELHIIHVNHNPWGWKRFLDFQKNHKLSMHNTNRKSSNSKNYYFPTTYINWEPRQKTQISKLAMLNLLSRY